MAYVDRRVLAVRGSDGHRRRLTRYRVRYRDYSGKQHSETFTRRVDAERRRAEIEMQLGSGDWRDPRRGDLTVVRWAETWLPTRHDLRATTWVRLETTMNRQVLPRFGPAPLNKITNAQVRQWVSELLDGGLSAATVRKAVFALRQCLEAAVADGRLSSNPANSIPLPPDRQKPARYLSQVEVERLIVEIPERYRALVLVGAYAGLRWGEAAGLRRRDVDPQRSRIRVAQTAVQLRGQITLDNEPKTKRSVRSIPVARAVMRRLERHLDEYTGPSGTPWSSRPPGEGRCSARSALPCCDRRFSGPDSTTSPSTGSGTASWPSWWRQDATSARSQSGPATTAWPSP